MTETTISFESLLKVRRGAMGLRSVALQALYSVSYGARFLLKKQHGQASRVMPLEVLWWIDDPDQQRLLAAVAAAQATMADTDRDAWSWQAMIMQPAPIGADLVAAALAQAWERKPSAGLARLRYVRWAEGRCAQLLHVGPYAEEGPSIERLHQAIAAAGYLAHGRHHEIYSGDPPRSAPQNLRTIPRHPVRPQQA